jgi:hypothetical protein
MTDRTPGKSSTAPLTMGWLATVFVSADPRRAKVQGIPSSSSGLRTSLGEA